MKTNIKTGNNPIDISLKQGDTFVVFSCKYNKKFGETDVGLIHSTMEENGIENYKVALIVKNKDLIINHRYKDKKNVKKIYHDEIQTNGLLFDEQDAIRGLGVFSSTFSDNKMDINEFIEFINGEYFLSPRRQLTKKLHQEMTLLKFIDILSQPRIKSPYFCLAHKPRSGKSISLLTISDYLLKNGYPKILFLTSVPATIDSFVETMDTFIDFRDIKYILQKDVDSITETFTGILLCSTEYLKMDKNSKKSDFLKRMNFDVVIIDESHQGSSNDKTKSDILEVDNLPVSLELNSKLTIFASGTSQKTQKYYRIPKSHVFEWEMEDESYMKQMTTKSEEMTEMMVSRHGGIFINCLNNLTLDRDYSRQPTQVLMKHTIQQSLIDDINSYNSKYNVNFGYQCSTLFALRQTTNTKGEREYLCEFEICSSVDGEEIMKSFLESIISSNKMYKSVMKQIEKTQTHYGSRKSTIENPLLFIVYLPVNTGNNTISKLQEALKNFLIKKRLWEDYQIEYSNSIGDTGDVKEEYNEYIKTIMSRTKTNNKRGCILLLGNKGTVGITYKDCDVTISLDSGHNLDTQKQKYSRALTEASGKTIGINVDMNVQRTYSYINDMIHKHRKSSPTKKSNAEILQYLFENNIFLFDPNQIDNGNMTTSEILSYYQQECSNMLRSLDDSYLLDGIECNDDMRDIIKEFHYKSLYSENINKDLEGENQNCPKGGVTNIKEIDGNIKAGCVDDSDEDEKVCISEEEEGKIEDMINKTCELCKQFLFPLMALLSRIYKIHDFKDIFTNEITFTLIMELLKDKIDLDLIKSNMFIQIMSSIIDINDEIVNNIREIYCNAPSHKLRSLIEKHFIPSQEEKKKNAEIPTPVSLVDEMLEIIPLDFWKMPKKVFEPCCGKGNFVLGIFDKFWVGLEEVYPDIEERCRVIISDCLSYADITPLNVFITTEILKCHVQSYCGLDELDYEFHGFVGDTLKMEMSGFDAVIGNPPYQDINATGDNKLYLRFIKYGLSILKQDGYLLFITPTNIKNYITNKDKNRKYITDFYELLFLSLNTANSHFKGISTYFAYFLLKNKIVSSCNTRVKFMRNKEVEMDEIVIYEKQDIPLCLSNLDFSIINKCSNIITKTHETYDIKKAVYIVNGKQTQQRIRNTHISKGDVSQKVTENHRFPIINKINKSTPFPGEMYYSKFTMEDYRIPKIVMCTGGYLMPSYDEMGEYNLSDNMIYLLCDSKQKYRGFVILVNSKLIKYLNLITMTDNIHGRDTVIQCIKMVNLDEITNDDDIYRLFNLSQEEIVLICKTINK